jgi:MFS family permease
VSEPWFDEQAFGMWFGAIGGGVGGALLGCLGALAGMLIPRGRGRGLVMGGLSVYLLLGVAMIGFGVTALMLGQPYGIWYGPMLEGVLFTVLCCVFLPLTRSLYRQSEQRRIDAEGLRHS